MQQLRDLARRNARQGGGHVEQVALIERGHELAADMRDGVGRREHDQQGREEHRLRVSESSAQHGLVQANEPAIDGVAVLARNAAADQITHQHRDQRDRQPRRGGHRVGLGEGERREQPPLLGLQREDRNERERDDQERREERRPHLDRRIPDHPPLLGVREHTSRMGLMPDLHVLVGVFDHDDRGVHHRSDGDRDAPEGHDVGVDPLVVHDDERRQHAQRQRHDRNKGGPQMKEERRAHECDDEELLDQLTREILHRALDESRAIVRGDDFDTGRQARLQLRQLRFDGVDGFECVLARAHDDDAAGHLSLTIQVRDPAPHLGTHLHVRHVAQAHRHPGIGRGEGDAAEVLERAEVTRSADHVLRFGKLEHRAAGLLVRVLDRADDLAVWDVERAQALRIEHYLVLAHHAAQRCDFGHVRHGLELVLQEPVLQRPQLGDVQPVTPVDERVLVDPADAGGIRAERGPRLLRQTRLHRVQILEHARAGPVQVRAVLEQDVDE